MLKVLSKRQQFAIITILYFIRFASSDNKKNSIGQKMSELYAPELFRNIWSRHFVADDFLSASRRVLYNNMLDALIMIANMTDGSIVFCEHVFRIQLYQDVLTYLESTKLDPSKGQDIRLVGYRFRFCFSKFLQL